MIRSCLRNSRPWVLIAALALCATPALPDSIIEPLQTEDTAAEISEIENYLAANYGIFLGFMNTTPQNLELIEDWYGALLPSLYQSFPTTTGSSISSIDTQEPGETTDSQQQVTVTPEPATLELLCCALAAFTVGFHVPLRRAYQSFRNRLHPET